MHRRRHGRIRTPGLACRLYPGDRLGSAFAVENLSMGGAFVRSATPLREGSPVVVDFSRPGSMRSLRVTGRVVRAIRADPLLDGEGGMGIRFDPLTPDVSTRLSALLAGIAPGPVALEGDLALNRSDLAIRLDAVAAVEPATMSGPAPEPLYSPPADCAAVATPVPVTSRSVPPAHSPGAVNAAPRSAAPARPRPSARSTAPSGAPTRAAAPLRPAPAGPAPILLRAPPPEPVDRSRMGTPNQLIGAIEDLPPQPSPAPDAAKLMVQIRGLLLELADWQYKADSLEREKRELSDELERVKQELTQQRSR